MKKHLLALLVIVLSFTAGKTFAQDVTGGSSSGDQTPIDGGGTVSTPIVINPPSYVSNVKRNNGNGTSAGLADVRLSFSDKQDHPTQLVDIRNLDGSALSKGAVVMDGTGTFQKGYLSYALHFNIAPKNKLLFHFNTGSGDYWIPEAP